MINSISEIMEYVDIAFEIFSNSGYATDIKIIKHLFKPNVNLSHKEIVALRLTVIDSLYSTNMSKRLYGIESIVNKLTDDSRTDNYWKIAFQNLINNNNDEQVACILNAKYGINKNGKSVSHSVSLISKYAYFLTDYEFPIYDSLVKIGHDFLSKKYTELEQLPQNSDFKYPQMLEYFQILKRLNRYLKSNDNEKSIKFEKLDCFLWTIGKIKSGNFQNLMSKIEYCEFINKVKNEPSEDISLILRQDELKNNKNKIIEAMGSKTLSKFTEYVL